MSTATVTSKGQVTLPKDLRTKLHLETGEKIDFRVDVKTGTAILTPLNRRVEDVFGMLGRPGTKKHLTVEDMEQGIKASVRRRRR